MIALILAVGLVAMGCVKAERVRGWRTFSNPSAPEISDSVFVLARVVLFGTAAVCVFSGFRLLAVSADAEWSDDELSSVVSQATSELHGTSRFGDTFGDDSGFDQDIAKMIEEEVIENGGGGAPQSGVDAGAAAGNKPSDADYTVQAAGADGAFCVHVVRTRSKDGDYEPPGVAGGPGSVTVPSHDFSVTSREGAC
ncbi:hypothetical protein ABT001_13825 [Streptomyces sp. NPDC002793]|uniref:hypothetical protein n=1 Tax=Streptomyces sp. NPDC002793 TaxID=3154432 RepID=UPI00332DA3AD